MGNNSAKNASGVSKVVINYQTSTIEAVYKNDGTVVTEGDAVDMQVSIINQQGGIAAFVEQQYGSGMQQLVAQAIEIKNQLHECSYMRGEISRVIKTHVVEIVRSVHLFIHFYENGNEARWEGFSQIAFAEIKQLKRKLKDIQEHLETRTKEHEVSSFFSKLLRNLKMVLQTALSGDVRFVRNQILYVIKQLTAQAHLRNQLTILNNKVNNVLDPITKVEQGLLNLHSAKKNEMSKHFYLPILRKHNVLLEGLLKAEYFEVETVSKIIKDVEDEDRRKQEGIRPSGYQQERQKFRSNRLRGSTVGTYDAFASTATLDVALNAKVIGVSAMMPPIQQ